MGKQPAFFLRTGILRDTGMVSRPNVLSSPLQEWPVWQLASWMTWGTRFKSMFSLMRDEEKGDKRQALIQVFAHFVNVLGKAAFYSITVRLSLKILIEYSCFLQ